MSELKNKRIILGITGGIAAYKSAELARLLIKAGAQLQIVMTHSAQQFITPLTFEAITSNRVRDNLFDRDAEAAMGHIELARWADAILIAPASADFLAKLTHGSANDLLTTICLATTAKIAVAPAMNRVMWQAQATQDNLKLLQQRGINIFGPGSGEQACGENGLGRMSEPKDLLTDVTQLFKNDLLSGKAVLITAGPTQEAIDPVRYITNKSSGKMGFALAQAAAEAGADVTLVSGPVNLATPACVHRIDVMTAQNMYDAVMQEIAKQNIFIASAAVADYHVKEIKTDKINSEAEQLQLNLVRNPDILASVTALKKAIFTVGFAAQTSDLLNNAKQKIQKKKCDVLVANIVGEGVGFNVDENAATILYRDQILEWPLASKQKLARDLIQLIGKLFILEGKI